MSNIKDKLIESGYFVNWPENLSWVRVADTNLVYFYYQLENSSATNQYTSCWWFVNKGDHGGGDKDLISYFRKGDLFHRYIQRSLTSEDVKVKIPDQNVKNAIDFITKIKAELNEVP